MFHMLGDSMTFFLYTPINWLQLTSNCLQKKDVRLERLERKRILEYKEEVKWAYFLPIDLLLLSYNPLKFNFAREKSEDKL